MMYPVFLDLKEKQCLVVGGGKIALRKVLALLRSDAIVTVISIDYVRQFRKIASRITLIERSFEEEDIHTGIAVVIGATNDMTVNRRISQLAKRLTIPCNIVDQPALCSFIVPAVVRRGDITVAISTNAVAPRLSKYCKSIAAEAFKEELGSLAAYLGDVRKRLFREVPLGKDRAAFWEELFTEDPVEFIENNGWDVYTHRAEKLITHYHSRKNT